MKKEMIYFRIAKCAIGNSLGVILNLYKHVLRMGLAGKIEVHYIKNYHRDMLLCVPVFHEGIIKFKKITLLTRAMDKFGIAPYSTYPCSWLTLRDEPVVRLEIPKQYKRTFDVPVNSISIHVREKGSWDLKDWEPERFVDVKPFHKIAIKYADMGYRVIQIGDPNMTRFPKHPNIFTLSHVQNKTLMDDFYAISKSRCFLATDSGMWPAGVAFNTPTILSNSCQPVSRWWPWRPGHPHLNKKLIELSSGKVLSNEEIIEKWGPVRYYEREGYKLADNTIEELDKAVSSVLRTVS